ncbi:2-isopropylmalate synthase [Clostridium aciditolerans]|uniref:2-isopropylmalate synthase n=1 Tax=Clostridium aciditolerans TaxID=339861 RepID=A0A934HYF5_9CLOT|nr:2-isopropylmalate synthase [Clostridium aciditolerans]MBI6874324.1 2-isopropylmalate synthase [Clostridium aciditolerans]
MTKKIYIFDTTLRDGEQTPGVSLNIHEKLEIAKQLQILGVDIIEAGFPFASKGDFEAVKAIAKNIKGSIITGLARTSKQDIDTAWEALKYAENPRIHTFIATSDIHMQHKLNMKPEEVLERAGSMVKYAKSFCPNVEFSPEDGTRTRPEFLYRVLEAVIEAGADVVNIPDTVGYTTPGEYGAFIKGIRENVPNIHKAVISVHCHNDLGLAVANSLAAIENGAQQIECAVNGLGERAGNAALEEIVMSIKTRSNYFKCHTDIVTEHLTKTSNLVSHLTGVQIQNNKAIVGSNAFAHESGIHQHGVLNCRETYEIMTPESVGLKKNLIVLGKHSGRHAFEQRLKEIGYDNLDSVKVNDAFLKFKDLADKKKSISDEDIEALIKQEVFQVPENYKLEHFQVSSGNNMVATSTVKIRYDGNSIDEASCGDGPVDATFKAIEKAVGVNVKLKDYFLKAIGSGKDALGEVTVKIEKDNKIFSASGVSTDVVEASAKAFINAINKMHYYLFQEENSASCIDKVIVEV